MTVFTVLAVRTELVKEQMGASCLYVCIQGFAPQELLTSDSASETYLISFVPHATDASLLWQSETE